MDAEHRWEFHADNPLKLSKEGAINRINYTGIAELQLNDEMLAKFYEGGFSDQLYLNQYVILKNSKGEIVDTGRWAGDKLEKLKYKKLKNDLFGEFAPKNLEQQFAFDALQNPSITGILLSGGFGSGKTILCLVHALSMILYDKKKPYTKLVFLRNNIPTKNTVDVGALPSDLVSKIKPFAMLLADILGEESELDRLIEDGVIALEHLGFIRGRSYKNTILYVSEGQNLTRDHMALIISRCGEGSRLFVEGDVRQSDKGVFDADSGIAAMAEALKGDPEFAMVTLQKNERSRFASLSDKLLQ